MKNSFITLMSVCAISCASPSFASGGAAEDLLFEGLLGLSLEELINVKVTAQKREENISDIPMSLSVITADDIQKTQSYNLEQLSALDPSLTVRKGTTNRNSALHIRGIGTTAFSIGTEPGVSTVIDGVVMARSGQAFNDLFDVERIEVLHGPQGTLFGKNASAGAVNITTKAPTQEFVSNITSSAFEDNQYRISANASGPLSDNLRARVSGYAASYDGNITNVHDNGDINGYDHTGIRARFDWDVTNNVNLKFIADISNANDDCCGEVIGTTPSNSSASFVLGGAIPKGDDTRKANHNLVTTTKDDSRGLSLQAEWALEKFTITSITGYRKWDNTEIREGDFLSDSASYLDTFQLHDYGTQSFTQISEELRIASPQGQELEWLAGLFFWDIEASRDFNRTDIVCTASILPVDASGNTPCAPGSSTYERPSASAHMKTKFSNHAAFGSTTLNFMEDWSLTLGGRLTRDEVEYSHSRSNTSGGLSGPGVKANDFASTGSVSNTDLSLQAGLQFDVTDNIMSYVSYKQGYKGPAFNVFFNMDAQDTSPIDAEKSETVEVGFKYSSPEKGMALNVALFSSMYDNYQETNFEELGGSVVTRLTNAGEVVTSGVEVDMTGQLFDDLIVHGALSYVDAKIKDFNCPDAAVCSSRKNEKLSFSPDLSFTVSADYRIPLKKDYNLYLNSSYHWQDDVLSDSPDVNTKIEKHGIWDASLHYVSPNKKHTMSLYAKNILDQSYASLITSGGPGGSYRYHIPQNADRYFGLSYKVSF
jgi:iron complex outermembrane receptor protein